MIISYLGINLTIEVLGRLKPSINYIFIYEHCGDVEFLRNAKASGAYRPVALSTRLIGPSFGTQSRVVFFSLNEKR